MMAYRYSQKLQRIQDNEEVLERQERPEDRRPPRRYLQTVSEALMSIGGSIISMDFRSKSRGKSKGKEKDVDALIKKALETPPPLEEISATVSPARLYYIEGLTARQPTIVHARRQSEQTNIPHDTQVAKEENSKVEDSGQHDHEDVDHGSFRPILLRQSEVSKHAQEHDQILRKHTFENSSQATTGRPSESTGPIIDTEDTDVTANTESQGNKQEFTVLEPVVEEEVVEADVNATTT